MLKRNSLCCLYVSMWATAGEDISQLILINIEFIKHRYDVRSFRLLIKLSLKINPKWILDLLPMTASSMHASHIHIYSALKSDGFAQMWRWGAVVNSGAGQRLPGVVEEAAVPQAVLPSGWRVEETRVGAIEAVQAVLGVLGGVAVNDVQQHHDAHWMSHIYQLLKLIWGTVPTTNTHTYPVLY